MKKTLNTCFAAVFAMAACMFAFTSCSDDDDNGKAPSGNGNPLVTEAKVLFEGVTDARNGEWEYRFEYDDQLRPYRSIEEDDGEELFYIDYKAGKIDICDEMEGLSVSFNSRGYITKISGSWDYKDNGDGYESSYSGSLNYTFSYDANGQLTSVDASEKEKSVESGYVDTYKFVSKAKFTWKDGNLVKCESSSTEEFIEGDREAKSTSSGIVNIAYGNQSNKYRQYTQYFGDGDFLFMGAGLLGVGPKNLPQTCSETYHEKTEGGSEYDETYTETYTFTLNDDGTINTEKSVDADNGYVDEYKYHYMPAGAVSSAKTKVAAPLTVASAKAKIERLRKALGAGMFVSHGQSRRAKLHNR